jgi:hypothetical protein
MGVTRILVAMCLLLAVPAVLAPAQDIDLARLRYTAVPDSGKAPEYPQTIDAIATAVGVRSLHGAGLPAPYRELRIWFGFGLIGPPGFVRIVTDADHGVVGEMYHWSGPSSLPPETTGYREWMRQHYGCVDSENFQGSEYFLCRVQFPATFDWRAVLDTLNAHHVWTLPDQDEGVMGLDGWSLVVEAREGPKYHTFEYWVPEARRGPSEEDAEAILDYAWNLSRLARHATWEIRDVGEDPRWCSQETPYSRRVSVQILRFLRENRGRYQETQFDPANWGRVEEEACSRLTAGGYEETNEYRTVAYTVEAGFLVFEIGRQGTVAEGCGELERFARDFESFGGQITLCFPGTADVGGAVDD